MADISAIKEITDRLENGVQDLFESDKYAAYLQTMSRFHRYSTRNTLLIHLQMPDATRVAGFKAWQTKFNRFVKKGEKAIRIFAPAPIIKRKELEKIDPETQLPIIGEDGEPVREEVELRSARYISVSVFDIQQTDGEPLPTLVEDLPGNVARFELFMDALKAVSPLTISFENLSSNTDGICHFGDRISIRSGMSEIQTVSAVIHEITHAKLHDLQIIKENGENPKDLRTEETEAESISYTVCQYYGIETEANSFGYVFEWSRGRELKELNESLDTIRKTAAELIDSIDERYRSLAHERGIDLTISLPAVDKGSLDLPIESTASDITTVPDYGTISSETRTVGTKLLMSPVFIDGNFNRDGKKIRVTVHEPAGKYQLFSREEGENHTLYFLTASGLIDRTSEYFRDFWNEEKRQWINYLPNEAELDELILQIQERFERDMANPTMWAKYQHAALLNRLDECDAHNAPVRQLRKEESEIRKAEAEREQQQEKQQKQEKYAARIDEIAHALENGQSMTVAYNEYEFDGKNPVLDLFKLYGINLPLRTQGWVNTGLAEITANSYRYYKGKHKGDSKIFSKYLSKLREAIKLMPLEQKRQPEQSPTNTEVISTVENHLYNKFAELFPDFINGKYSYMRLESEGFEPLSLEWIGQDRLSVMHTYTMNGDLMYDPMIEFDIDRAAGTLTAVSFEQSMPPLYQNVKENGDGISFDGNGNERSIRGLQKQINKFASLWFDNIAQQGFMPIRADLVLGEDKEVRVTFDKDGTLIKLKTNDPDISLPDPSRTVAEMNEYGYTEPDMLPLSVVRAVELFDTGHPIYLLYPDNTEAIALDQDEIITFCSDGFCGITIADWEMSSVYAAQAAVAANAQGNREADLLYGSVNKFGIYQIPDAIDNARDLRFTPVRELEALGLSVDRTNYELIYTGNLDRRGTIRNLNKIYADFQSENPERPADYQSRSVSVSDVIVLQWDGNISSHFVDSIGFVELPSFTGDEKQPTIAVAEAERFEKDPIADITVSSSSSSTVAQLETDVKAGKSIALTELARAVNIERKTHLAKEKPSLLARLDAAKKQVEQNKQSDAIGSIKERGIE